RVLRISPKTIDVVPNGVDHDEFHPPCDESERRTQEATRQRLGLSQPYFLFVGGVDPRKQVPLLIDAFARAKLGEIRLVFAGRVSDEEQSKWRALAAEKGVDRELQLLGHVSSEDLVAITTGAIALAYPSRYEGFGLPVLEAMACGTPAITTRE